MRLKHLIAIVTGAGRGIGKATAAGFVAEGATVILADNNLEAVRSAARELQSANAIAMPVDIGDPASVDQLFAKVVSDHQRIDVLVNNAGIGMTQLFLETSVEDLDRIVRTNLMGTFLCCQHAARQMLKQSRGRIINITSLAGQTGCAGRAAYGASKAGVELLTKVMAVELSDKGINVNAIAPGPIMTEMAREMHSRETQEAFFRLIPQRRYGEPTDVAGAAVFLASDDAEYITGHTINVDGGFRSASLMLPAKRDDSESDLKNYRTTAA